MPDDRLTDDIRHDLAIQLLLKSVADAGFSNWVFKATKQLSHKN
uniref:Uncharacterized protein n=1 Tax=Arundo donax TaxID=35708 RepID=A0A0A8ZUV5_ARUDO